MKREQWFPGREIDGVLDLRHATDIRRGERSMVPAVYCETSGGVRRLREGDYVVTDDRGLRSVERAGKR